MKQVLIVGLGKSGQAAAKLLLKHGTSVIGIDSNIKLLRGDPNIAALRQMGLQVFHEDELVDVSHCDGVIASPGIPTSHRLLQQAVQLGIPLMGELELGCRYLTGQTVLGVTGTNGKTTVTLLVEHVLKASGLPAIAVGNVGLALCELIAQGLKREAILVMELSSYQLESLHLPIIDAGVILNITPDHLERHKTMDQYAMAKLNMAHCLKASGTLFIQQQAASAFRHLLGTLSYQTLPSLIDHDAENTQAAWELCRSIGVFRKQFDLALSTFKKPPHRIEFVRCHAGVSYFDDSKGTNIDAVVKAVNVVPGPILLIAGGVDKGASYHPWIQEFKGKVKTIFAIGQAAPKIAQELSSQIAVQQVATLEEAVLAATLQAFPGESVLLSPGCSSFDMFRDYAHRGDEFKKLVFGLSVGEKR